MGTGMDDWFQHYLGFKFNPNQPRDESGRFSSGGAWTGSVKFVGDVPTERRQDFEQALSKVPDWAMEGVKEIEVYAGPSTRTFDAGGQNFEEGAHWSRSSGTIRIYQADTRNEESFQETLGHEAGHSAFDQHWSRAAKESVQAYGDHEEWFDNAGFLKPEYRAEYDKSYPFGAGQEFISKGWDLGEDGVTGYSRAWAKEGKISETYAELTKAYTRGGVSGVEKITTHAPNIRKGYLAMVQAAEHSSS